MPILAVCCDGCTPPACSNRLLGRIGGVHLGGQVPPAGSRTDALENHLSPRVSLSQSSVRGLDLSATQHSGDNLLPAALLVTGLSLLRLKLLNIFEDNLPKNLAPKRRMRAVAPEWRGAAFFRQGEDVLFFQLV